ncbi:MAG: hypothetical protein ACP5GZ_03425 [Vulcanisaeta sp.]|jgi:hypothetical protein|uniref:hypothetical protein n=1 Tax=Vulcanisaeta sp. TaxID=2020871 RepID=UPI003D09C043
MDFTGNKTQTTVISNVASITCPFPFTYMEPSLEINYLRNNHVVYSVNTLINTRIT